jgi:hypothetical protein
LQEILKILIMQIVFNRYFMQRKKNILLVMLNYIFMLSAFMVLFSACEKIIDVDLNEVNPGLVIEGNLSFHDNELQVKISRTASYFDSNPEEKVSGADVFLDMPAGVSVRAGENNPGFYSTKDLILETGRSYVLRVEVDGVTYSAGSVINQQVVIDSLSYRYYKERELFDNGYRINMYFNDPSGKKNFYRIKTYENGSLNNGIDDLIVFDDSDIDGKYVQVRLRGQIFSKGDTAKIELISIDEGAWKYFTTLRDVANLHPGSPAPANPVSNFNNGALGYFSAWSNSHRTIIIDK